MEQFDESKRIPIDQFMSFADARLVGGNPLNGTGSILWDSMLEAMEAARKERKGIPANPEPMGDQVAMRGREPYGGRNVGDVYTVTPGLVEGGAVGRSVLNWPERKLRGIYRNGIIMPIEMLPPSSDFSVPSGKFVYEGEELPNG